MVHYGKHIIDPDTGLCEVCDRGTLHDYHQAKRPGKRFLYSNQDGKFTYRPNDDERHDNNQKTPGYVRKPLYPAQTHPALHEQSVTHQRKATRRDNSPSDDVQQRPPARLAIFYYVDNTGQMVPRSTAPPDEPRRRYIVQNHHPISSRPVRAVNRRAQTPPPPMRLTRTVNRRARTPPPPATNRWRSQPRRNNDSGMHMMNPQDRGKTYDSFYYHQSPRRVEMYHIEASEDNNHYTKPKLSVRESHMNNIPPSKNIYHGDTNRKRRPPEPIPRTFHSESEPPVPRKTYKKLSPIRYAPRQEEYNSYGNHAQSTRKVERIYPKPRHYDSSPQLTNRRVRSPLPNKNPSIYYLQSPSEYY